MKINFKNSFLLAGLFFLISVYLYTQEEQNNPQNQSANTTEIKSTLAEASIHTSAQCGQCKKRIEKAVNELKGIHHCELEIGSAILSVKYDTNLLNLDEIRKKITMTGYDADSLGAVPSAYKKLPKCCQKDSGHN